MKQGNYGPNLPSVLEANAGTGDIFRLNDALNEVGSYNAVLNYRYESGRTLLHVAVASLKPQSVEEILKTKGGKEILNIKDVDGRTALDITYSFFSGVEGPRDEIRGILIKAGAKRAEDLGLSFYSRNKLVCNLFLSTAAIVIGFCAYKNPAIFSNLKDFASKCLSQLTDCVMSR